MRYVVILFVFASFVFAQTISLEDVLVAASDQALISSAQAEFEDARAALRRAQADPLGTRLALAEAEKRYFLAEAKAEAAYHHAAAEVGAAYTEVFVARAQRDLLLQEQLLSERELQAAQVRLRNGSATELDVEEALTQVETVRKDLRAAEERLGLSRRRLESLITLPEGDLMTVLRPLPNQLYSSPPPPAVAVLQALENHLSLLEVRQERRIAEINVEILDPLYAAPAEIESARAQLATLSENERTAEQNLRLDAQRLLVEAQTAKETCEVSSAARADASERLSFEQRRLDAGLLSEIDYLQAEINARQADLNALEACNSYLITLWQVQAETGANVGLPQVPEAANAP